MFRIQVIPGVLMLALFVMGQPQIVAFFWMAVALALIVLAVAVVVTQRPGALFEPLDRSMVRAIMPSWSPHRTSAGSFEK
ncbi:MAG: hypothetical protein AAF530_20270 [Pseudomonadota bacterium]